MSPPEARALQELARVFGHKIEFFTDAERGDGFVNTDDPKTIHINTISSKPHLVVLGHEVMHHLRVANKKAYDKVEASVLAVLKDTAATEFVSDYGMGADLEEVVADLLGNRWMEPEFLSSVFQDIGKRSPKEAQGIINALASALRNVIDAMLRVLGRAEGFRTDKLVTDLTAVREALKSALAEYAEQTRPAPTAKPKAKLSEKRQGANPITVVGYHYSKQERKTIDSAYAGTGYAGAERERGAVANRINFYVDTGRGIHPESGVGGYAHKATLTNLYDSGVDPEHLKEDSKDANDFERRVVEAGYDGYYAPDFRTDEGAVVLLGKHRVSVEPAGRGDLPPTGNIIERAKRTDTGWRATAALFRKAPLPMGSPAGSSWGRYVKAASQQLYDDMAKSGLWSALADVKEPMYRDDVLKRYKDLATRPTAQTVFSKDGVERLLEAKDWAVLTAEDPAATKAPEAQNREAMARLRSDLEKMGASFVDAVGKYGDVQNSFAITGITEAQALELGQKYGQESVLVPRGLVYSDGRLMAEATGVETFETPPEDFYTEIPSTGAKFTVGMKWSEKRATMSKDELIRLAPYMKVSNQVEFKQRLQWLSEGMLRNHIDSVANYVPNQEEIALYRRYRGLESTRRQYVEGLLTEKEREKLRDATAQRVVDLFNELPSGNEMAAVAWAGRAKRGWYERSALALSHVFGPDAPRFAALLAALSPQNSAQMNLENAVRVWKGWVNAGRPTDEAGIKKILAKNIVGEKGAGSVLQAWVPNSIRALSAEDPTEVVLSGPKVDSFMRNLVGDTQSVTIDAWMANYALVDQRLFGGRLNSIDAGKGTGYLAMSARVRGAARTITNLTGEEWTPAEVQETIWSWAKTLFETQAAKTEPRGARELVLDRAITDEMIAATPDFGNLLNEEQYAQHVRDAGLDPEAALRAFGSERGAASEASPFAADAQQRYELQAARRLERLHAEGSEAFARRHDLIQESPRRHAFGQLTPAQEQALANVGGLTTKPTVKEQLGKYTAGLGMRLRQQIVDQFAPLQELDPTAYMLARMSKGADGTLEAAMLYGKPYLNGGVPDVDIKDGGFAKTLAKLEGEHDRFLWWVAAQRAEGLKSIGLENLFSTQDIASLKSLNQGNLSSGASRGLVYQQALMELTAFNASVLKLAEESGLIDAKARQLFSSLPYVPFYRVMEDESVQGPRFSSGLVNQRAWKKLKGGSQKLNDDLLANVMQNWGHLYDAAAKNRAAVRALRAAEAMGLAFESPVSGKGTVRVMENGVAKFFLVDDPAISQSISALEYVAPNWLKPLSTFKRWLTIGVTASPAFKIRNLLRDSLSAIAQSSLSVNVVKNVAEGWANSSTQSQMYASMMASGGVIRFGSMLEGDRATRAHDLITRVGGQVLDEKGWQKLLRQMHTVIHAYNELGDRSENVNRVALYKQLRDKGVSHEEASFMSRDLLDFSMSGRAPVVRFLAQTVPFFNARLQGLYKLGRAAKDDPARFTAVTGAVVLASMALMLAYQDDDDWKKREDWDRDTYWWFKIGDIAYRIPKPFEIGAIGTLAERTWEMMFNKDMTAHRYGQRLSAMLFQTFAFDPTPQVVKPLLDVYANQDSFTGRPIESEAATAMRPEDRATESTTMVARLLGAMGLPDPAQLAKGRYAPLSPVQIDYLTRAYFGWMGSTVVAFVDAGMRPLSGRGERPDYTLKDLTLGFVETQPGQGSRYVTAFYEQVQTIEEAWASYSDAVKRGDSEAARSILAEEGAAIGARKSAERTKRAIADINARMRLIEGSPTMTGEAKRAALDALRQQRSALAQGGLALIQR